MHELLNGRVTRLDVAEIVSLEFSKKSIAPLSYEEVCARESSCNWLTRLNDIFQEGLRGGILDEIIIHGSHGDYTQTNFSDLEITVIINNSVLKDSLQAISFSVWVRRRLNWFILSVDPLQHHGAFYLREDLVSRYDKKYYLLAPMMSSGL